MELSEMIEFLENPGLRPNLNVKEIRKLYQEKITQLIADATHPLSEKEVDILVKGLSLSKFLNKLLPDAGDAKEKMDIGEKLGDMKTESDAFTKALNKFTKQRQDLKEALRFEEENLNKLGSKFFKSSVKKQEQIIMKLKIASEALEGLSEMIGLTTNKKEKEWEDKYKDLDKTPSPKF